LVNAKETPEFDSPVGIKRTHPFVNTRGRGTLPAELAGPLTKRLVCCATIVAEHQRMVQERLIVGRTSGWFLTSRVVRFGILYPIRVRVSGCADLLRDTARYLLISLFPYLSGCADLLRDTAGIHLQKGNQSLNQKQSGGTLAATPPPCPLAAYEVHVSERIPEAVRACHI